MHHTHPHSPQAEFNALAGQLSGGWDNNAGFAFSFDEPLSHLIYAASDIIVVRGGGSRRWEQTPCQSPHCLTRCHTLHAVVELGGHVPGCRQRLSLRMFSLSLPPGSLHV